jgi:hypothetical protein
MVKYFSAVKHCHSLELFNGMPLITVALYCTPSNGGFGYGGSTYTIGTPSPIVVTAEAPAAKTSAAMAEYIVGEMICGSG